MNTEPARPLFANPKRPSLFTAIVVPLLKGMAIGLGIVILLIVYGRYYAGGG